MGTTTLAWDEVTAERYMPDHEDVLDVLVESGVSVAVVFDDAAATWADGTPAGSMPTGRTIDVP